MTLDYATCPHCGCRCQDDEYCAACARPFHADTSGQDVSIMGFLEGGLRLIREKTESPNCPEDIGEEATITPLLGSSWHHHYGDD